MRKLLLYIFCCLSVPVCFGATITGTVKEKNGGVLAFSSILVKGTTSGVTANSNGFYSIQLEPGEYHLVCQFIGYQSTEKKIRVGKNNQVIDFELESQQYNLRDVVVTSGGEDPAYEIIRKTIEKRVVHLNEIKRFQSEVYLKGQLQLRNYPKSFLGRKIDFEDGDSSKKKMLFLSESIARYSVEEPNKQKIEVLSTKVSGRSNSFGFSNPQIISFYENNISIGENLNPRGFISPIASGAMNFYKYRFEGTFYENGKEISRIKVIPKRTYEPLFSGYIQIVENEWRIQSVDLLLLKDQQMQLLDTLRIQQLYVPAGKVWVIKSQVIYPSGKLFGFDFFGSFVQVYDKFDMAPRFQSTFFDHTLLKFYDSSNKKTMAYWDSIRPLPLLPEEALDYRKKDSLEQVRKDPAYLDSLDRKRNKFRLTGMLFTGQSFTKRKKRENIGFESVLSTLNYNTVEGGVIQFSPNYRRRFDSAGGGRQSLFINPDLRYGFANKHLNPSISVNYAFGKKYLQSFNLSFGRRIFQYNNAGSISARINSLSTLLSEANHLKIYEANYIRFGYSTGLGNGFSVSANFQFQDRFPLNNLANPVSWKDVPNREFTPNFPIDLSPVNMQRNQAASVTLGITWLPGADYIEYPDRKINLGSKYPTLTASITRGINGLFGSDVDYTRWRLGINDDINLKLGGQFQYNLVASGFLNVSKVFLPDYQHYLGNQTVFAARELSSFQLAPYYLYSNVQNFNLSAHAEYHLNGLLTNKIPFFKKLNWFLVTGVNVLHINKGNDYVEALLGIENILKVMRVDFVQGFENGGGRPSGFRITLPIFR